MNQPAALRASLFGLLMLSLVIAPSWGAEANIPVVRYVSPTGSDMTGDGSEWAPFATIQRAIGASQDEDTVIALPGVYRETIDFQGKDIVVASRFLYTGNEDDILDAVIDGGRSGHVVTFAHGETGAAKLVGLTITGGRAAGEGPMAPRGGGIFCWESPGPTLTRLRVVDNEAQDEGGGLYFAHCAPVLRNVYISGNRADGSGGGVRYSYGRIDMENAVITGNAAGGDGGGLHFYHAEGAVRNAVISDNVSAVKGGGLGFDGCSPLLTHVTIAGNRTTGEGGGLNVSYLSRPELLNSIVWGNAPEQIAFDPRWGGQAITIRYSDIQGGEEGIVTHGLGPIYWGPGNMDASPRFVSATYGNHQLREESPAIGAALLTAPPLDLDGRARPSPAGSNPDMGAYEHPLARPGRARGWTLFVPAALGS